MSKKATEWRVRIESESLCTDVIITCVAARQSAKPQRAAPSEEETAGVEASQIL